MTLMEERGSSTELMAFIDYGRGFHDPKLYFQWREANDTRIHTNTNTDPIGLNISDLMTVIFRKGTHIKTALACFG